MRRSRTILIYAVHNLEIDVLTVAGELRRFNPCIASLYKYVCTNTSLISKLFSNHFHSLIKLAQSIARNRC